MSKKYKYIYVCNIIEKMQLSKYKKYVYGMHIKYKHMQSLFYIQADYLYILLHAFQFDVFEIQIYIYIYIMTIFPQF